MDNILIYEAYDLKQILQSHGVPVEKWGMKMAKTVNHLQKEIDSKECYIEYLDDELVRFVEFVGVNVTYKGKILKEDRQKFKDGRVRKRQMSSSVSEKMIKGEDPFIAAMRGIEEEIGVTISRDQLKNHKKLNYYDNSVSKSYPGLKSKYKGHKFECELTDDQYDPDGYVEIQEDKNTYFVWVGIVNKN